MTAWASPDEPVTTVSSVLVLRLILITLAALIPEPVTHRRYLFAMYMVTVAGLVVPTGATPTPVMGR